MLIALLVLTLALFAAGIALPRAITAVSPFWAHLVLAVGVMALVTAAMQHFVPVLTRSRGVAGPLARLPWLMLAAGLLVLAVFQGWLGFAWIVLPALLAAGGAAVMLTWMVRRGRAALGGAHPGLSWYVAAMACLGLGLATVPLMLAWPEWHGTLRAFHIHINLYGFVGLTAIGTLQVLMPTVAGQPDPQAASRLRSDLKWAVAGAGLLAVGQAIWPPLAWLGAAAWAWVLGRLGLAWWRLYRPLLLRWDGGEPVLMAALIGFACALVGALGLAGESAGPLAIFLPGFLFPLVTGAAGHLAPVWLQPGATFAVHAQGRARLVRHGGIRALLFLSAAVLPVLGYRCAGIPALAALLWFGAVFALWLYRDNPSQE